MGQVGRSLWDRVQREYQIEDCGGVELLTLACEGLDRAAALRERIDADGEVIEARSGLKSHPALRDELANRAFVAKALQRLGLSLEPVRPVGRPPKDNYWAPDDEDA